MSSVEQIFAQPAVAVHASVNCERPDVHKYELRKLTVAEMMANLSFENELEPLTREEFDSYIDAHQGSYSNATSLK